MKKTGKGLNIRWNVNARHALYRADGKWYHLLTEFPAALFDETGYVLFKSEQEYSKCPQLNITQHIHVPHGISAIPSYVFKGEETESASDLEEPTAPSRNSYVVNRIIRDTAKARRIKLMHDHTCQVCGTRLLLHNGQAYSEGHHIQPLGSKHSGPDVESNLICVCPNCHAQLDYGAIQLNKKIIRAKAGHAVADKYLDYHNANVFKGKK